jgi:hypothetical protein
MNYTEIMCPGPVPDGETPVSENPAFVSACMSTVSDHAAAIGWSFGNSILTHSDIWGFVFRIDLQSKYRVENSRISHRFVCWSAETDDAIMGTALFPGLELKPL